MEVQHQGESNLCVWRWFTVLRRLAGLHGGGDRGQRHESQEEQTGLGRRHCAERAGWVRTQVLRCDGGGGGAPRQRTGEKQTQIADGEAGEL